MRTNNWKRRGNGFSISFYALWIILDSHSIHTALEMSIVVVFIDSNDNLFIALWEIVKIGRRFIRNAVGKYVKDGNVNTISPQECFVWVLKQWEKGADSLVWLDWNNTIDKLNHAHRSIATVQYTTRNCLLAALLFLVRVFFFLSPLSTNLKRSMVIEQ